MGRAAHIGSLSRWRIHLYAAHQIHHVALVSPTQGTDFPDRFGSPEHATAHADDFFPWYNTEHRHSGLGLHTPHDVHFGLAAVRREHRALVLAAAFAATPERFVRRPPTPAPLPTAVWINPPKRLESEAVAQ